MGITRDTLITEFADGQSPTGAQFKTLIESIVSRADDGIQKFADTALSVSAGKELHAPVIHLCPKDVFDPHWVLSLKVGSKDGLNITRGNAPTLSVLYLDKISGNMGLGTGTPAEALSMQRDINGRNGIVLANEAVGDNSHVMVRLKGDDGEAEIFKNSSLRLVDGGSHAMTVRNNTGDLRLLAAGEKAKLLLKGDANGFVGINTDNPTDALTVNGNLSLQGNSLYFPLSTYTVDTLAKAGVFWSGSGTGAEPSKYGIYKTEGTWAAPAFQQLKLQFDTGIQMDAGTGSSKSFVEVMGGKGLMVTSGKVGVGTVNPAGRVHVVTTTSEGDPGAWGNGQLVVGQEAANGPTSGGIGLSYSTASNMGAISSLSPGAQWRNLVLRANAILFANGLTELMRLTPDGKLGVGTTAPDYQVESRKDGNIGLYGMAVTNVNNGVNAFVASVWKNDTLNHGVIIKNSSTRTNDGGPNTMTVRNEGGDLRLQAQGGANALHIKATTGHVGVGTAVPSAKLHVVTAPSSGLGEGWAFDASSMVVGQEAAAGAASGGLALSYSPALNASGISSLSPGIDWRDLAIRAKDTIFYPGGGPETMRVTNNGRVGIGTPTPDYMLDVRKDQSTGTWGIGISNMSNVGDSFALLALRAGTSGAGYLFKNGPARTADGGPNALTLRNDSGDLRLQSVGGNGLFVKANTGQVGIGTATPLGRVHVVTPASDTNVTSWDQGQFVVGQDNNGGGIAMSYAGGTGYLSALSPGTAWRNLMLRGNAILFNTPGAEAMRVNSDNNVGIGTPSPKAKLTVNGGNIVISASDNAASQNALGYPVLGGLYFYGHGRNVPNDSASIISGSTTWDDQGFLAFQTSNDGAASTEKMRITETGRVGIGEINPRAMLHLSSNGKAVDGNGLLLGKINDQIKTSAVVGEELGNIEIAFAGWRDSTPNQIGAKISAVRIASFGTPNTHLIQATELSFSTGDGIGNGTANFQETCAERMRIKKDGKVGIGTILPISTLGVAGNVSIGAAAAAANAAPANGLWVQGDAVSQAKVIAHQRFQLSPWNTGTSGSLELTTGGASPISNRLIFGTDNSGWKFAISKRVGNEGAITDILSVNDDGKVGIGGIYPGGKLHVVTTASDGIVGGWNEGQMVVGQAGANGGALALSYGSDTAYITAMQPGVAWRPLMLRASAVLFNTNTAEVMRVNNNNMVGIGTNNPLHLLDIQQGGRSGNPVSGRPLYVSCSNGPDSGGVEFRHENGTCGIGFGYQTIYATGSNPSQDLGLKAIGTGNLNFYNGTNLNMMISGSNNCVGIGTATPAGKLHVLTNSSSGDVGTWDSGQFVVGREGNLGAIALSYDHAANASSISSLSPNTSWRDLNFRASNYVFRFGGNNLLKIQGNNFVGIGTMSPDAGLSIGLAAGKEDTPNTNMHLTNDCILFGGNNSGREANSCQISAAKHVANTMCIVGMSEPNGANRRVEMWAEYAFTLNGKMGIGTRDPQYPLHIPAVQWAWVPDYHYMNPNSVGHYSAGANTNVSIWTNGRVVAPEFNTVSDARIKKNVKLSNPAADLQHLQQINVNDYEYRDQIGRNADVNKGFIAQQIKAVFPEAVSQHSEFVPDIFAKPIGSSLEGKVEVEQGVGSIDSSMPTVGKRLKMIMAEPHSLLEGDTVRIISAKGTDERVVKVIDNTTFSVEDWRHGDEGLFVYGKRVDDFMVVDYNRIYTLNVSATQELHRTVETLKQENNSLRADLDAAKTENARMLADIAAIKKALNMDGAIV